MGFFLYVTLLIILSIGISKQQCPNNYPPTSYMNNMPLKVGKLVASFRPVKYERKFK